MVAVDRGGALAVELWRASGSTTGISIEWGSVLDEEVLGTWWSLAAEMRCLLNGKKFSQSKTHSSTSIYVSCGTSALSGLANGDDIERCWSMAVEYKILESDVEMYNFQGACAETLIQLCV